MVNSKNVAFKVDKQGPRAGPPPQPFATVINCRKPGGKRAVKGPGEVRSQQVPLTKISRALPSEKKRKREVEDAEKNPDGAEDFKSFCTNPSHKAKSSVASAPRPFPLQQPLIPKPTRLRANKALSKHVDMDCWYIILSFTDPGQLLAMRSQVASFYRVLNHHPMLWKLSRDFHYGDDMPDPPPEITEFQFADLRHGHGCMSCGAPSTRKTYWAFLRRWCKPCFQSKVIKEEEAGALFKDRNGEDISFLKKCLQSGVIDSWRNFVGVGPARTHSLKTVYLVSDIRKLVADFLRESEDNHATWHAEMRTWVDVRLKVVEERHEFARRMELWEDQSRTSRSYSYQGKKDARRLYFIEKAAALTPPISIAELEHCPAYRRAIVIPKEPNMTSWLQLKPKLEKEIAEFWAQRGTANNSSVPSTIPISDTTTPIPDITDMMDMF